MYGIHGPQWRLCRWVYESLTCKVGGVKLLNKIGIFVYCWKVIRAVGGDQLKWFWVNSYVYHILVFQFIVDINARLNIYIGLNSVLVSLIPMLQYDLTTGSSSKPGNPTPYMDNSSQFLSVCLFCCYDRFDIMHHLQKEPLLYITRFGVGMLETLCYT